MSTILTCSDLSKSFGTDEIFSGLTFQLDSREKLGILGSNGTGKSTLLKTIVGEISPDEGTISFASGVRVGYLAQYQKDDMAGSILDIVLAGRKDLLKEEADLRAMEEKMSLYFGQDLTRLMEDYRVKSESFERKGGLTFRSEAAGVLKGLGFTDDDFTKEFSMLSGGQKTRVHLGRILQSHPDLLILDEPINHLDLKSIEWLEGYLRAYPFAVIIVAHDRYFLNRTIDHVLDLSLHPARLFKGNYREYTVQKKEYLLGVRRQREKQLREIDHEKEVIKKLQSFNREKSIRRAESRKKALEKIEVIKDPEDLSEGMQITFTPLKRSGNDVLTVEGLSKSYDGRSIFSDISFQVRRLDRVAIIGDNGTGKTTTLKIINGLIPADKGTVKLGANVEVAYYDQEQQGLDEDKTLFSELSDAYPGLTTTKVRSVLAAFRFSGDSADKKVRDLSGGERGRVALARLMLSGANFLILDEPTNHLDMESKEILEDALNAYEGTLLFVSHDRYFINQTAKRILDLSSSGLKEYLGNYDYYLMKKEEANKAEEEEKIDAPSKEAGEGKLSYEEQKKRRSEKERIDRAVKGIEKEIQEKEDRLSLIDKEFEDPKNAKNSARLNELTKEREEISKALDHLYEKWEAASLS